MCLRRGGAVCTAASAGTPGPRGVPRRQGQSAPIPVTSDVSLQEKRRGTGRSMLTGREQTRTRGLGGRVPSAGVGRPGSALSGLELGTSAQQREGDPPGTGPTRSSVPVAISGCDKHGRHSVERDAGVTRPWLPHPQPAWASPSPSAPWVGEEGLGAGSVLLLQRALGGGPRRVARPQHVTSPAGKRDPAPSCRTALMASGGGGVSTATGRVRAR